MAATSYRITRMTKYSIYNDVNIHGSGKTYAYVRMDTQNNIYKSRARGLCSKIRKQRFLRDGLVVKASASQSEWN